MSNKYYITAAIPYVNGDPHIGHALEFVQADAIARYQRLMGKTVTYLCGADENSLKNVQSAEKEGLATQALCDRNAARFEDLFHELNTTLNIFQRSSDKKLHYPGSQKLWELCEQNGDIYKKKYSGKYCVGCETFYTEKDLIDGKCPEHLREPEIVEEENYFFRLSKYQDQLVELIESDKLKISPETRKNEVLSFVKSGLEDFSISRSKERAKNWGIPVPSDDSQIIYVWFDALNVYQTGIGFGINEEQYQSLWPTDLHVIGKGIIRFHAVYWPAILLSAGLQLPKEILTHGYINVNGQKMSKSLGNVIDPFAEVKKYGIDPVRHYLLSQIPVFNDGDYNEEQFRKVYNADLANGLGNLVARVAKLCEKSELTFESSKTEFKDLASEHEYHKAFKQYRLNEAIAVIWEKIKKLDQKINEEEPWKRLALYEKAIPVENHYETKFNRLRINPEEQEKTKTILFYYIQEIRRIACLLEPFLPDTAEKIKSQFTHTKIQSQTGLFPRLD